MIKLIASDLDGTLLRGGAQSLAPQVLELIGRIKRQGILFAAASGRQYRNLERLFYPVGRDVVFVAENGGLVMQNGLRLSCSPIRRPLGDALMRDILSFPDCEVLLCGQETCYISPRQKSYGDFMVYTLRNTVTVVDDLFSVNEDYIKISAYIHEKGAARMAPYFIEKWGNSVHTAIAGEQWVDFTVADKGSALRAVQEKFRIARDEIAAFGDNFNDVPMFEAAGHSFAMDTADRQVQKHSSSICSQPEIIMEKILAGSL